MRKLKIIGEDRRKKLKNIIVFEILLFNWCNVFAHKFTSYPIYLWMHFS